MKHGPLLLIRAELLKDYVLEIGPKSRINFCDWYDVVGVNKLICEEEGNPHHCYGPGKIESALHSAFYPGTYPFIAGGLAKVAGTLCFYLIKTHAFMDGNKRTAAIMAITFLNQHGQDLSYPLDEEKDTNSLAQIIDDCAAGNVTKEQLADWFELHKSKIEV